MDQKIKITVRNIQDKILTQNLVITKIDKGSTAVIMASRRLDYDEEVNEFLKGRTCLNGLRKIHEPYIPVRPVVSLIFSPTY